MTTSTPAMTPQSTGRSIRTVDITLDSISFPAGVFGSVVDQDPGLESLCVNGHAPTKIKRTDACPVCNNEDRNTFRKGKVNRSEAVVLDADKLGVLQGANEQLTAGISISVVDADDSLMFPTGSTYYVAPKGKGAGKTYALLAAVIKKRPKLAFLGELSMGGQPKLYRLGVIDGVIVMRELARPEALRAKPEVTGDLSAAGVRLMEQLVDEIKRPFDPAVWRNRYCEGVAELLDTASSVATGEAAETGGEDLLERLQASLAKAKAPTQEPPPRRRRRSAAASASTPLVVVPDPDGQQATPRRRTRKVA